jgi:hypothetical protein
VPRTVSTAIVKKAARDEQKAAFHPSAQLDQECNLLAVRKGFWTTWSVDSSLPALYSTDDYLLYSLI